MAKPTLRQLEILMAVAEHGSFSAAGKALHLSQPGVSMQIKQLQDILGMALIEQLGKTIRLTSAGVETVKRAKTIYTELENLQTALADQKGLQGGELKVCAVSTASVFAARALAMFRERYPQVHIRLDVLNRDASIQRVVDNQADIALMGQPPDDARMQATAFLDNPLVVIAATNHRLCAQDRVPVKQLLKEPLVGREPGSGTRAALERFLIKQDLHYQAAMEMNKNEAIKHAVEAGLGIGVVSLHSVRAEIAAQRLSILNVQGFPLKRHWYLVQNSAKQTSAAMDAFTRLVFEKARRYASKSPEPTEYDF